MRALVSVLLLAWGTTTTVAAAAMELPAMTSGRDTKARLTFAWPARVAQWTQHRRVRSSSNEATQAARFEWITHAIRRTDEVQLVIRSLRLLDPPVPPERAREQLQSAESIIRVVSGDGRTVLRIDGVGPIVGSHLGVDPERAAAVARAAILDAERENWQFMVGAWVDLPYSGAREREVSLPTVDGSEISLAYAVQRDIACSARDKKRGCVRIVFRSTKPLTTRGPGGQTIHASIEGAVVTEPATLLPHRFDVTRRSEIETAGQPPATYADVSEYTFRYE